MDLYSKIQSIKVQIVEIERLLLSDMSLDHNIISEGLTEKLSLLKQEVEGLTDRSNGKQQVLFKSKIGKGRSSLNALKSISGLLSDISDEEFEEMLKVVKS